MRTFETYLTGYIFSILLTLAAYLLVVRHLLSGQVLIFVIMGLALIQLWVQLIFFLHLDYEKEPRWNLFFFLSTVSIILVVVVGSLWIMKNLSYHMPSDYDIMRDEAIKK